jgi:hypothetical protein
MVYVYSEVSKTVALASNLIVGMNQQTIQQIHPVHCNKIAEAEAAVSVNEKKW